MIDASRLLEDLKRLRRGLDADLRVAHAASAGRDAVRGEWQAARDAGRTRETFETFFDVALDKAGVHWVLACVFLRFLEDNGLIDPPMIGGPQDRLELARERHATYFRAHPHESDLDWLLWLFRQAAQLPGLAGLFDPTHNPLFGLPVSGDGAGLLRVFFQKVVPETGAPVHDFTDPTWDTRFLGNLYQDLSELARKRYALLQTPEFVESWILDRTLEPAIREFSFLKVRMIDPACGSGHFLLGGFQRLLREWQVHEPDMPAPAQARRALDAVAGVDLNPFAVEVARFRLLLVALRASGVRRLRDAPDLPINLAAGDSLLHGRHFARHELGGAAEGFGRVLRHHYATEDSVALDDILGRQYHTVVGNPPYITTKDEVARDAYRHIYESCYRTYSLGVPFTERFFDLAVARTATCSAGFVGEIVANSFMKAEFGKRLVTNVLPKLDLTHIIDTSSAHIPGHTTPTAILFGRNQPPVSQTVRTTRVVRGAPSVPPVPEYGPVWQAIISQTDNPGSANNLISSEDTLRESLSRHPWVLAGDGGSDLKELMDTRCSRRLAEFCSNSIGGAVRTGADDVFVYDDVRRRHSMLESKSFKRSVSGTDVRNWICAETDWLYYPYDGGRSANASRELWPWRTNLEARVTFQGNMADAGLHWTEYMQHTPGTYVTDLSITFAEIVTHNHFAVVRDKRIFRQTSPAIKLSTVSLDDHIALTGLLNSSIACFWMKLVMKDKGGGGIGGGLKMEFWDRLFVFGSTKLEAFPIPGKLPGERSRRLDEYAQVVALNLPASAVNRRLPTKCLLERSREEVNKAHRMMIAIQEELDWECHRAYGILDEMIEHPNPPPLQLGERAFEIVMARRMANDELETAWFTRHNSTPITDLPDHWPDDYRVTVERRIALIETDPAIGLIERPEYKRRWSSQPWEELEKDALRTWLLGRLEAPSLWPAPAELLTTNQIADRIHEDADFFSVAALYCGRDDFNLEALVAELIVPESVPFQAALRYTETGRRARAQWEETWRLQRQEDAIDAEVQADRPACLARVAHDLREARRTVKPRQEAKTPEAYDARIAEAVTQAEIEREADRLIAAEQTRRKQEQVGLIPVPPKYTSKDFQSHDCWRSRDGLDVPKERFVYFPGCSPDADGSLLVTWAGYDHLARALAIGSFYQASKDERGWPADRLIPLLAGLHELLPWLLQWHNDAEGGQSMGDYFTDMVRDEALALCKTVEEIATWVPPARPARGRRRTPS